MAKCVCGREMLRANGCRFKYVIDPKLASRSTKKKFVKRLKVGEEGWVQEGNRCGDCGAKYGYFHHVGCDMERYPICGGQLITCDCWIDTYTTTQNI